jgi:RHH-type transcriptional regulator, rel operon repressor / antitoxin RelB
MLTIQLDADVEKRLEAFAARFGKSASYFALKAIVEALDEWEDVAVAVDRLKNPGERLTMAEVENLLGLDG